MQEGLALTVWGKSTGIYNDAVGESGIDGLSNSSGHFGPNAGGEAIDAAFDHSLRGYREQARGDGGCGRVEDHD